MMRKYDRLPGWNTTRDCAEELGCSRQYVNTILKRREVPAEALLTLPGRILVSDAGLEILRGFLGDRRPKRGGLRKRRLT